MTPCKIVLRSYRTPLATAPSVLVYCRTCQSQVTRYSGTAPMSSDIDSSVLEVDTVGLLEAMQAHMDYARARSPKLKAPF